jgi:hypothetical protein
MFINLIFLLLNDNKSQNTLNILHFIKENIDILNKNKYKISIKKINREDTETENFKKYINSKNITNIPCLIVYHDTNEQNEEIISGIDEIGNYLNEKINFQMNKKQKINLDDNILLEEEDTYKECINDFMNREMNNYNKDEDKVFDSQGEENDIGAKLRKFTKKRKSDIEGCKNENKMSLSEDNDNDDDYQNQMEAKIRKGKSKKKQFIDDDDDLTKQLLEKMEL